MALGGALRSLINRLHSSSGGMCIGESDVKKMREAAGHVFNNPKTWHALEYPGEMTLPIHLLPLCAPVPEGVHAALEDLHQAMVAENFPEKLGQEASRYEQLRTHLWLATMAEGQYYIIGRACFFQEDRPKEEGGSFATGNAGELRLKTEKPAFSHQWWLQHVWLRPAYRNQRIFRYSIPYFEQWHPGFLVLDPWPVLERAMKEHPGHVSYRQVKWF